MFISLRRIGTLDLAMFVLCVPTLIAGCGGGDRTGVDDRGRDALAYLMSGDYDRAVEEYKRIVQMYPGAAKAYRNLGLAYASVGKVDSAIVAYKRSLEIDPGLANAYNDLGVIYFKQEEHALAEAEFKRAIGIAPEGKIFHYNLGALYHLIGRYEDAAEVFEKVIALDPSSTLTYYMLGVVRSKQGRYDKAIGHFSKVLKINPDHAEAHYEMALVYSRQGRYREAIGEYRRTIELDPNHTYAHHGLGSVYLRLGEKEKAARELRIFQRLGTYHKKAKYIFFAPPDTEVWRPISKEGAPLLARASAERKVSSAQEAEDYSQGGRVQFVDAAKAAGITFKHTNGASGEYYYVETTGGPGVAFFDYDNDGDLDIYIVNGADLPGYKSDALPTNVLYRNNGDGTFIDVTEEAGVGDGGYGMGVAAADYDNDGDQDLFVTNFGPNVFYRNNGDGTFTDVTEEAGVGDPRWSTSCAFLDYDNDGYLDLYVANYVDYSLENNKICTYEGIRGYCDPYTYPGAADILYHNDGDGTFTDVTRSAGVHNPIGRGLGVVCGDYDNDGDVDIYVANDETPNFLYQNNGDGTFTDVSLLAGVAYNADGDTESGMGTDFGDFDNDGDLDIFVNNFSFETATLYRNEGDGFFTDATFEVGLGDATLIPLGFGGNFFDYDNDGDLDIFIANGHVLDNVELIKGKLVTFAQKNQLLRNDGGRYTDVSSASGPGFLIEKVSRGAAFGDYDDDGDMDIFVGNCAGTATLLRNNGGNSNNWLMIKTVGTKSNRDGIGARIKVVSDALTQIKEIRSGSSYASQNDLRVLFGLGGRAKADLVEIRWPSGVVQTLRDVTANQLVIVKEGQTVLTEL